MKKKLYSALVFFLLVNISLFANEKALKIDFYSFKDGLTTSSVNAVFKDSKGFLWICSSNGLFRYDGYSFRNLNAIVNATLSYEVYSVAEDKQQNIWIGTKGKGIFVLLNKTFELVHLNLKLGEDVVINQILFLKGKVWAASNIGLLEIDENINFLDDSPVSYKRLIPDLANRTSQDKVINCLYNRVGSKILWVGTNAQLYAYNVEVDEFSEIISFPQNSIRCLSLFDNKILAGSWDGGVFVVDTLTLKKTSSPFIDYVNKIVGEKRVKAALPDNNGNLFVATYGSGLYAFDYTKASFSFINYRNDKNSKENIRSNIINQAYIDNSGILWLSMNQPGLAKLYSQDGFISFFSTKKSSDLVSEFLSVQQSTDKNKLWVATNGDGIYLFDTKEKSFLQFNNSAGSRLRLQSNGASYCFQDSKGNLWIVSGRKGIYVVPGKKALQLLSGKGASALPLDANLLFSPDSRANSYITKFYEDSKGYIWVGSWGTLYVLRLKDGFQNASNPAELAQNCTVKSIFSDERKDEFDFPIFPAITMCEVLKDEIWVGTSGGGVFSVKETSGFKFSVEQLNHVNKDLPQLNIRCISKDKQQGIWIGTSNGLCYLNKTSAKLKLLDKNSGLSSDDIGNIVEDKSGALWVSTNFGIAKIDPENFSVQNFLSAQNEELNQYILNAGCYDALGNVWFSTPGALSSLNSDSTYGSESNLPFYFTDIKIDNKTVVPMQKVDSRTIIKCDINECNEINVPYNHTLSVEFATLNFKASGQMLYKYKIGKNKEWIMLGPNQRNISFSSMKPGFYFLEVQETGLNKKVNFRLLKIRFLPPFWQTKIAFVIYFFVILLLFLMYRRLTIQKVLQQSVIEKERYERKKLEELDKMKTEFFSNISHEFRTPLSLIINPLEKLSKGNDISEKNKEKINIVLKSSNRLLKLTNELMDYSKIEKNLLVPEFQLCEIVALTEEICQLFNGLAESMNIEFKINNATGTMAVPMDKMMIEKVIFNLLSNAFKYTPANGTILVNIETVNNFNKDFVKVSVVNSGEGITKENLSKVFDRFYQVNNVQNRNVAGTGIGLSLVKSYVELHNGIVDVKSEPNVETTFEVYLPIEQTVFTESKDWNKNAHPAISHEQGKTLDSKPTYHYHLLIVEDEEEIRNYIVDELKTDFNISVAADGEEGLRLANELIPDLIITDVMMPKISGIELCKTLKNQLGTSHIPIIILSAKANINQQIEGLEMGADVYMVKPFSVDHLKIQVLRLIGFKENIYSRYLKETTLIPEGAVSSKLDDEFMKKLMAFIEANLTDTNLNVDQLADCVALSKVQTYRKVKAITGLSIVEFVRTVRLKKAVKLVLEKRLNYTEIAYETGFSSPSYFTRCFHDHFGKTPSEFAADYGKE